MAPNRNKWNITPEKFLSLDQVNRVQDFLLIQRDLAIARKNKPQAIKDYYIVRTLLESGLRVFEFCELVESDVQGHRLIVRNGKGGKSRTVLLTKGTATMLREWVGVKAKLGFCCGPGFPLFPSRLNDKYTTRGIQKRIKIIFKAVKLPPRLSCHSLRHSYCSFLFASGKVGLPLIRENMGHGSIAITNLYAHSTGDLSEIELFQGASSHFLEKSELKSETKASRTNYVKDFLRKANLK